MNILVIEASGAQAAIAALEIGRALSDGSFSAQVRVVWSSNDVRALSRELVIRLAQTMQSAGWERADVDALAVGLGPGSWTSLRVVLATGKTLAQARGWRLCGVPSFDAFARAACRNFAQSSTRLNAQNVTLVVASRSRADELYSKIFRVENFASPNQKWTVARAENVGTAEQLRAEIADEALVLLTGEAARDILETFSDKGQNGFASQSFALQKGAFFQTVDVAVEEVALESGLLAAARLANNQSDDALSLQPLYVALSAAERNLAQRSLAQSELAQ